MADLTFYRQPDLHLSRFGGRVRSLRHSRGWSMDTLARLAGLSRKTIGKLEAGLNRPIYRTLNRLARAFEVPPGELLAGGPLCPDDWPTDVPDDYAAGVAFTDRLCDGTA